MFVPALLTGSRRDRRFREKRSKILTWFNFATLSMGTMTEVEEDEEEAETSEPGRSSSTDIAYPQIAQLAKNEWLLAAFHDRQLILGISSRVRK
jgi:hypothetical protein